MNLKDDISQAIQKNLPAAVAQELKTYLADAEQNLKDLEASRLRLTNLEIAFKALQTECEILQKRVTAEQLLTQREFDIDRRERAMELTIESGRRLAAENTCNAVMELTRIVFKNPTLTYNTFGSKSEPVTNNGYTANQAMPFHSTTTVEDGK